MKKILIKNRVFIILLLLIGILGIKALFHQGFYTSHDGRHQIIRLMHFHQGLIDGQLPVRWAGTALAGYGYPLFVFTYRLPFWLGEGWYLLSHNLGEAVKFVFIITYLTSGLTMYWFAKELWDSKKAGFLSAVLYLWAPYRFLDIFVRAALGEAVTFVFLPLLFLGLLKLRKKGEEKNWFLLVSLSLAGIILSHAITLGLWLMALIFWFGFNFWQAENRKRYFCLSLLSGLLALFLTAYYWLPAALERKYTAFFGTIGNYYQAHFVTLKQLLYSPWGYGFSFPGTENDMMSFQVGIAHWLVVFLSLFLLAISLFKKKRKEKEIGLLLVWQAVFLMTIYLMTSRADWFYQNVNKFFTIDIPWRFLGVAVFCSSVLGGSILVMIKNQLIKWGLVGMILALGFYGNRNHIRVNQYVYFPESEYWQSEETSNEYNDYMPRWFNLAKNEKTRDQLIVNNGESENQLLERRSNLFSFKSKVKSPEAEIITRLAYYPGWLAFVDGEKGEISYHDDGRIRLNLSQGEHLVELFFKETKLRKISNGISLSTLLTLTVFLFLARTKHGRKKK